MDQEIIDKINDTINPSEDNAEAILDDTDGDVVAEEGQDVQETDTEDSVETEENDLETPEADDEGTKEQGEFKSLSDFAEALDIDVDQLLENISTTVKIDGQEIPVTLKELHSGYQKESDYRKKTSEIAETRRQFEQYANDLAQQYSQRIDELEAMSNSLEEMFLEDFNGIDWNKLRSEDPANYAALQQDMESRKQQLQNAKMQVYMKKQEQQQEFQKRLVEEIIPAEFMKLQNFNPDWADANKWQSDYKDIAENLMSNYGFQAPEIANVVDSRMIALAWDALQYKRLLAERENGVKKIKRDVTTKKKLGKVLKPGAKQNVVSNHDKRVKAAYAKLKKSGSVDDAAELILQRMG